MPQNRKSSRTRGAAARVRAALTRLVLGAAFINFLLVVTTSASRAGGGDDNDGRSFWTKFEQSLGLKKKPIDADSGITYIERPPLVVPPTRDLPPPVTAAAAPAADWPHEPAVRVRHAKTKREIVPATAVQTPNPAVAKKPWYDPAGWFSKEEYAAFKGEPVREDLTDPPAGYRIPSPSEPYGIGPDKKSQKIKAAGDGTQTQSGTQTANPAQTSTQTSSPIGAQSTNPASK